MNASVDPTVFASPAGDGNLQFPAGVVRLRPEKWRNLVAGHPWVFQSAVASVEGTPRDGEVVDVVSDNGTFIGRGVINSRSRLRVRIYSQVPDRPLDAAFWQERIDRAIRWRETLGLVQPARAVRLVYSESDGLSGLIVDRYDDQLVVQVNALAVARRLDLLLDLLQERLAPSAIYVRTPAETAKAEGLQPMDYVARGRRRAQAVRIYEGQVAFLVDVGAGQKTGYYIDQRDNRQRVARYLANRHVLDLFCYTGGFGLHALVHGQAASVVGVDGSEAALDLAAQNAELNNVQPAVQWVHDDAFRFLDGELEAGRRYGAIVLDPPKFARNRSQIREALRAYHYLNRVALRLLEPDGILVTCSCSGNITRSDFLDMLFGVAQRSARRLDIVEQLGHGPDHPVSMACPETEYLKCVVCRVE
ncbi:MAG: ribosomal RNA large subunit methyltransferase I [Pirellulaceae bacterium]|nr:MAG: ribosomal RNA large subunit methyltransferase I [Pirellulaceae bacterium]